MKERSPVVIFHLISSSLLKLREEGFIKKLSHMTVDETDDHSKSDLFTKLITAIQVFSVILQIIVCRTKGLTISQLELAVTAFSVCAVITYALVLYQPKDVQTVRILHNDGKHLTFDKAFEVCWQYTDSLQGDEGKAYYLQGGIDPAIPTTELYKSDDDFIIGIFLAGTIFGAVHCFGWSYSFPTNQEQLLWRIASVLTTGFPLISLGGSLVLRASFNNYIGLVWLMLWPLF